MKVFMTGSTGFIGSHLLKAFQMMGVDVMACRRSASSLPRISLPNEPIWFNKDLLDITSKDMRGCDVLLHCAAAGVGSKSANATDMIRVNVSGTGHLMEVASIAGIKHVVMTGSCHEYGAHDFKNKPIPPDSPLQPTTLYGSTKAAGCQLALSQAFQNNLRIYYGRIFSAYGEGQSPNSLWSLMNRAAKNNNDFLISSGHQYRDFIHVDDVVDKLVSAIFREDLEPGLPVVANIGSGEPQSVFDFVKKEWGRLGAKGQIIRGAVPIAKGEPLFYAASLEEKTLFQASSRL